MPLALAYVEQKQLFELFNLSSTLSYKNFTTVDRARYSQAILSSLID